MHEKGLNWFLVAFMVRILTEIVNNQYVIKHKCIRIQPTKMNNNVAIEIPGGKRNLPTCRLSYLRTCVQTYVPTCRPTCLRADCLTFFHSRTEFLLQWDRMLCINISVNVVMHSMLVKHANIYDANLRTYGSFVQNWK